MSSFKEASGIYTGIVIQTNDPEGRGRVKVFIPHISTTVYSKWTQVKKDRQFKFIGLNINSDLTDILDDLKMFLPWAEQAAPLAGETSSGRFNNPFRVASNSDTNNFRTFVSNLSTSDITSNKLTPYSQNFDNIGEKIGNKYDIDAFRLNDAFTNAVSGVNNVNVYGFNYTPEVLSNSAKGVFGTPNVGAHVWVFFQNNDPLYPVYFAGAFGKEDWQSIYNSKDVPGIDYPGSYENSTLSGQNTTDYNGFIYRNKFVINQKGGTIQIVNTDTREVLKFSHYSGSFKEFNNKATIELATANDQKLILGNQFTTIRGAHNWLTEKDSDNIIRGDRYVKVGDLKDIPYKQWQIIYNDIANLNQLFDIQRANTYSKNNINFTSPLQVLQGTYADCPVCKGNTTLYWQLNNSTGTSGTAFTTSQGDGVYLFNNISLPFVTALPALGLGGSIGVIFGETCPSCSGTGKSTSSMGGIWTPDTQKQQIITKLQSKIIQLAQAEEQMGTGGSEIINITKHKIETIGVVMNTFGSIRVDLNGKMYSSEMVIHKGGVFENMVPTPLVEYVNAEEFPCGNYTVNVCNKYHINVGAGGLHMKSYGPVNISGTLTNIAGSQVNIGSDNEINIDGGKRLSLVADVITLKQRNRKQVFIDSSLGVGRNLVVGGGAHIEGELSVNHISAPGEIQVTDSTVVYGKPAQSISGQGVQTGTACPLYFTSAGLPSMTGLTQPGSVIGFVSIAGITYPVMGSGNICIQGSMIGYEGVNDKIMTTQVYGTGGVPDSLVMAPHTHTFKNIPLRLLPSNDDLRSAAGVVNEIERVPALPINNGPKMPY